MFNRNSCGVWWPRDTLVKSFGLLRPSWHQVAPVTLSLHRHSVGDLTLDLHCFLDPIFTFWLSRYPLDPKLHPTISSGHCLSLHGILAAVKQLEPLEALQGLEVTVTCFQFSLPLFVFPRSDCQYLGLWRRAVYLVLSSDRKIEWNGHWQWINQSKKTMSAGDHWKHQQIHELSCLRQK